MKITHHTIHNISLSCCVDETAKDPLTQTLLRNHSVHTFDEAWGFSQLAGQNTALLDLGAHVGIFSLLFSARGHPVYAIEASQKNASLLTKSKEVNQFSKLAIYHYAVSDSPGLLRFAQNGPYGFVETSKTPKSIPATEIQKIALDSWEEAQKIPKDVLIKMDVEGHELQALKGMTQFLKARELPPLLIESNGHCLHWSNETPETLCTFLNSLGYDVYETIDNCRAIRRMAPSDLQWDVFQNWLCINPKKPPVALPIKLSGYVEKEIVQGIVQTACHPNRDHRAYLGRILQNKPSMLRHKAVAIALLSLMHDRDSSVKESVQWLNGEHGALAYRHLNALERLIWKNNLWKIYRQFSSLGTGLSKIKNKLLRVKS